MAGWRKSIKFNKFFRNSIFTLQHANRNATEGIGQYHPIRPAETNVAIPQMGQPQQQQTGQSWQQQTGQSWQQQTGQTWQQPTGQQWQQTGQPLQMQVKKVKCL